jgi:hypothetical protein
MHLLTREAVAVYLEHLDAAGILAVHISNRYVALEPIVRGIAEHFALAHVFVISEEGELPWGAAWALLTRDPTLLDVPAIAEAAAADDEDASATLWTDDYGNLLRVLKF